MKQLNLRHFNTNSKKVTVTVNFIQKETKRLQKSKYHFVEYIKKFSAIFRRFPIISEDCRRLPKIPEDLRRLPKMYGDYQNVRRLPKMSEDCRRCPNTTEDFRGEIFYYILVVILTCERYIFCSVKIRFFFSKKSL